MSQTLPIETTSESRSEGMTIFTLIWLGQLLSRLGSGLTGFALDVWVYQQTGSVTQFAFLSIAITLPLVLFSPIAGTFVDRWSRRWTMFFSCLGGGLCILPIAILFAWDRLEIWHIYLAVAGNSMFGAFDVPAFKAAITLMVPKQRLGLASGMTQAMLSLVQLVSPALGGVLISFMQLGNVVLLDFITIGFALLPLLCFSFQEVEKTVIESTQSSLWRDMVTGWGYVKRRPGLLGLILLGANYNLLIGTILILVTPLVLTVADPSLLGAILSVGGVGMLVGSVVLGVWGDRNPRMVLTAIGCMVLGGTGTIVLGSTLVRPVWFCMAFTIAFGLPIANGCFQILFQRKVTPQIQGRVFAFNNMFIASAPPVAAVVMGPLADRLFEPLLDFEGTWAGSVGQIIGTGPGRGLGFLLMGMGLFTVVSTLISLLYQPLRGIEQDLPDEGTMDEATAVLSNESLEPQV